MSSKPGLRSASILFFGPFSSLVQGIVTTTPGGRDLLGSRVIVVSDRLKPGLQRKLRRKQLSLASLSPIVDVRCLVVTSNGSTLNHVPLVVPRTCLAAQPPSSRAKPDSPLRCCNCRLLGHRSLRGRQRFRLMFVKPVNQGREYLIWCVTAPD